MGYLFYALDYNSTIVFRFLLKLFQIWPLGALCSFDIPQHSVWASQVALVVKNLPANAGVARDAGSIPGSERYPGEGKDPLQYLCLENSTDALGGLQSMGSQRVGHNGATQHISLCMCVCCVCITSLLSGTTECSTLILNISCQSPKISHISKELWVLLLKNSFRE